MLRTLCCDAGVPAVCSTMLRMLRAKGQGTCVQVKPSSYRPVPLSVTVTAGTAACCTSGAAARLATTAAPPTCRHMQPNKPGSLTASPTRFGCGAAKVAVIPLDVPKAVDAEQARQA